MDLALLSDIHGNSIALEAVLKDTTVQGIDAYWILGDLVAIGYDPIGVLEQLSQLDSPVFTRGNTDRYTVTGDRPFPTTADVRNNPDVLELALTISASFAWTQGVITSHGWYDWLAALPLEQRLTLPDGTRLLGVHAFPGHDDDGGSHPGMSNAELAELFEGHDTELICVGHTHEPMDRQLESTRVINLGSISNPFAPDLRASYVVLEADKSGYRVQHRRVAYDNKAVIEATLKSYHPSAEYIIQFQCGEHPGKTPHPDHLAFDKVQAQT